MPEESYTPIEVAVALSLYSFNVSPMVRAERIYNYFCGQCAELTDLLYILQYSPAHVATELAYPSAEVYVQQALDAYGEEARERVRTNSMSHEEFLKSLGE